MVSCFTDEKIGLKGLWPAFEITQLLAELDREIVSTMFSLLKQSITTFLILELIIQVSIEVVENI